MTIEERITHFQKHSLPQLVETALMTGIKIGYEATMKTMTERYGIDFEPVTEETTEETTEKEHEFELILK